MPSVPEYIQTIAHPWRRLFLNAALQQREDIAVYLAHAYRHQAHQWQQGEHAFRALQKSLRRNVCSLWPSLEGMHITIGIVNGIQRARNPAYRLHEGLSQFLANVQEAHHAPAQPHPVAAAHSASLSRLAAVAASR